MAGLPRSTAALTLLCVAAIVAAVATGVWGYQQYHRAQQLTASASALAGQNEQLQTQVGQLQRAGQDAEVQLELAQQPALPVTVQFRSDASGATTADFRSTAPSQLQVLVTVLDPGHPSQRRFDLALLPQVPHPSPDGWVFHAGEQLELSSDGFNPLQISVPNSP